MGFTSAIFWAIFLPAVLALYYIFNRYVHIQNSILLAASLIFYGVYGIQNLVLLLFCILLTFFGGLFGEQKDPKRVSRLRRVILISAVIINIGVLLVCKYTGFAFGTAGDIFDLLKLDIEVNAPKILLPVGLSFYVFQSSSYLFDVMRGKRGAEKNILAYAVFVSFFPTIVSGPIQKSYSFIPMLKERRRPDFELFIKGIFVFTWGFFIKSVLADRLGIFTSQVFDSYGRLSGFTLLAGAIAYSVQIYADFAGYSSMALGVSKMLGFELEENFRQPYAARSIVDFWKRWHISLTSWFREYLYIPLGGNRRGNARKYLNVLIVFLVSGLWHGASLNFIVWGAIHGVYQIVGYLTLSPRKRICERLGIDREAAGYRIWQRVCTFFLVMIGWIFFRFASFSDAIHYILNMFKLTNISVLFDRSLFSFGLDAVEFNICIVALVLLSIISVSREKYGDGELVSWLVKRNYALKFICFALLVIMIVVFGIYGPNFSTTDFIYAGF